jgi:hypothetical protein
MRVSILNVINKILKERFENLCENAVTDEFKKVGFKANGSWREYSLFDYSFLHARFVKHVDKLLKEQTGDINGVFSRKHNPAFLNKIQDIVDKVDEFDVITEPEKFKTIWDNM